MASIQNVENVSITGNLFHLKVYLQVEINLKRNVQVFRSTTFVNKKVEEKDIKVISINFEEGNTSAEKISVELQENKD